VVVVERMDRGPATGTTAAGVRAELASIVESSHDAIVGMTTDGSVTSWNPAAARLYGYPAQDIIGKARDLLVPAEGRAEEIAVLDRIMAGEEVERYVTQRVRRDGSIVTVSQTISPIVDDAGTVIGAATTSRRFSELQESRDRFEIRMDQLRSEAVDAAARFEVLAEEIRAEARQSQERFDVQVRLERSQLRDAADEYQARMSGPGARSATPPINAELQQAHDRLDVRVAEQRVQAHDAAKRFETQVHEAHDQTQHAQERFEELVDDERVRSDEAADRFQARLDGERDKAHSDKQYLEFQLQQGQRLEILGQLAGGVAHDFNNLLGVILNYAAFVAEELDAGSGSDLKAAGRDVAQIQRAAQRATALTHQLLAFARREIVQPRVLDLNNAVTEVQQLLHRTLGEDVVLRTELGADLWPVLADEGQIEQVLVNLAVNARDAMSGGGALTIQSANIVVEPEPAAARGPVGRCVRLRISDTGCGMPADVAAHVFEPFYTTKSDSGGTGLGLATVYGIVTQADGTITIRSAPGAGTTFTITFPVTDERVVPVQENVTYQRTPAGETVLIVEDEQALREVTDRIFSRGGYHVISAANGAEAVALAHSYDGEIHLVLTDVVMPNMLGKEVVEKIREIRPDVEVLYMSGYAQPVLASQGRLDPDVNLIEKPFSATDLIEMAGKILDGHFQGFQTVETVGDNPSGDPPPPSTGKAVDREI
jgi:PAS domain S-box-containing protein